MVLFVNDRVLKERVPIQSFMPIVRAVDRISFNTVYRAGAILINWTMLAKSARTHARTIHTYISWVISTQARLNSPRHYRYARTYREKIIETDEKTRKERKRERGGKCRRVAD
ncbi:hypothetical protein LOAG_00019 [Loa loa]|uniref:Uncharacterized protein n=1 Tax=Loa loa TaxID=7209 RepID=A0A1S0UC43_LOALO|nr:hypothetical protein LOAG_00019 [Loa loa]EFO28475.1 hypothetical protein LOAG_00019 [Loa loa]